MTNPLYVTIVLQVVLWSHCVVLGGDAAPAVAQDVGNCPDVKSILSDASRILLRQEEHQGYWCDRVLLRIASIQMRAHDFDGARQTIRGSGYPYGRNACLVQLAEAWARIGQREQALAVLAEAGTDHGWRQDLLDDDVTMAYLEYQISNGDLDQARKLVDELKAASSRPKALRILAVARAKSGNKAAANHLFQLAFSAATSLSDEFVHVPGVSAFSDEYYRAIAIWEVAQAQSSVAESEEISSTIQRLVQHAESSKSGLSRVGLLREAAVLAATINDRKTAKRLFRQAINARETIRPPTPCPEANKMGALRKICEAQVSVGYLDEALHSAHMIAEGHADRDQALLAIAVAQARAGHLGRAVETALSIEHCVQYENDALLGIVKTQIEEGDVKGGLATAERIANPVTRAMALLTVAKVYAISRDEKTARHVAARIQLASEAFPRILETDAPTMFDYKNPRTWGIVYEPSFTMASHHWAERRASELAAASMTLAQVLGEQYPDSYDIMFEDVRSGEIISALARAHAASGDANEALAWSRRVGSDETIESDENWKATFSVEQRVYSLIGVAEGILDRQDQVGRQ